MRGIGCDILSLSRFHKVYLKYPNRLPTRLLSTTELKEFNKSKDWRYLATRFSVKEAAYKATQKHSWKDYTLIKDENGKPILQNQFKYNLLTSISHENDYLMSMVCWV